MNAAPVEIRLRKASHVMEFEWADGEVTQVSARALRDACRCAECEAQRRGDLDAGLTGEVGICSVEPCGAGAVRLHFSDGHARGIYPFAYMRELTLI